MTAYESLMRKLVPCMERAALDGTCKMPELTPDEVVELDALHAKRGLLERAMLTWMADHPKTPEDYGITRDNCQLYEDFASVLSSANAIATLGAIVCEDTEGE